MKKLIIMLLLTISVACHAFDYTYKGIKFKCKQDDNTVVIVGFDARARDVVIPAYVSYKGQDLPVKKVSTFLNGMNYLTVTLVLEEGIEDIDKFCFNEFRKLQSLSLPSSIRHIGKNAIRDNEKLTIEMASNISEQALRSGNELWPQISTGRNTFNQLAVAKAQKNEKNDKGTKKSKKSTKDEEVTTTPANYDVAESNTKKRIKPSDVDVNIPVASKPKTDTYCVILANEKYEDVPEVEFAEHDGNTFREYCIKTLGIPEKHVKTYINASYTDIKRALTWMENIAAATDGQSKMIFYYAGHGIPNEQDKTAYLIPVDGYPKDPSTCCKLSDIYARLSKMNTQGVTVLLDACFSGVKRGSGQALVAARGVAIKPRPDVLTGKIVVLTAASDDETALSYKEKGHGMFTYFLLKKLQQSKGATSFGDLFNSISSEVRKNSMLENEKMQTPSFNVSSTLRNKWRDLHF